MDDNAGIVRNEPIANPLNTLIVLVGVHLHTLNNMSIPLTHVTKWRLYLNLIDTHTAQVMHVMEPAFHPGSLWPHFWVTLIVNI